MSLLMTRQHYGRWKRCGNMNTIYDFLECISQDKQTNYIFKT